MDFFVENARLIGLLFFFTFFCGVCFYALRPKNQSVFDETALIPLKDNDNGTQQ